MDESLNFTKKLTFQISTNLGLYSMLRTRLLLSCALHFLHPRFGVQGTQIRIAVYTCIGFIYRWVRKSANKSPMPESNSILSFYSQFLLHDRLQITSLINVLKAKDARLNRLHIKPHFDTIFFDGHAVDCTHGGFCSYPNHEFSFYALRNCTKRNVEFIQDVWDTL